MRIKLFKAILSSINVFIDEDYLYRASALAFTTMLAMVPLFVVTIFFVTLFPIFDDLVNLTENYLLENFVPTAAIDIQNHFTFFVQQASAMPLGSVVFLALTAIMLINTVEETLNVPWKTHTRRKNLTALLVYSTIILLAPLVVGFSIFVSTTLLNAPYVLKVTQLFQLTWVVDFLFPIIINTIIFTLMYVTVPNVKVYWKYGLAAGFLTAIVLNVIRLAFVFYIEQFHSYSVIYGVFAVIPIFMIWLYISWAIIIWGALLTCHLQKIYNVNSSN